MKLNVNRFIFKCENSFLFALGLLDTITSTADAKDCPGVCVHALATLICYDVLEDVACPSSSMKCCVEPPGPNATQKTTTDTVDAANFTMTTTISTTAETTTVTTTTTSKTVSLFSLMNTVTVKFD